MSWWTSLRDTVETVASLNTYNPARDKEIRQQKEAVNAQIKAYQDQTNLEKQQLDEARASSDATNRQIQEKQIRALRRTSSAQNVGLLGVGTPPTGDMNNQLGG
jgi:hypothetical protein